jgi:PKD domain/Bacterial Ig-like domain (group 3)
VKLIAVPAHNATHSRTPFRRFLASAIVLFVVCACVAASAQGTAVSDPAIPVIISASDTGSEFFILNQDLSLLTHSTQYTTAYNCAAVSGFTASSNTPRTLINDGENAYLTAQGSASANAAATAVEPDFSCASAAPFSLADVTPTGALASNDPGHGRYFVLTSFSGAFPDLLTVINNLNTNSSATPTLTQKNRISLDTNGQYTSMVTDVHSGFGLTAITELKTATSPGNLWVYSPGINTAFKILGPGGVALPALGSFIIPAKNNGNGDLLVLINQDGLTSANLASPLQDTTPFTIIDLGQLQRTFSAVVASGNTITLPYVTQIHATTSFYAMLGAAYNPVNHLLYALVGGGSSTSSVTESIVSYDPTNPSAPSETVVADVSSIPFTFGSFPQLALNAASSTLQILSGSPAALYAVALNGLGNTATMVNGSPFPDSNFKPTFVTANPLLGETYIASSSGQVDILTRPSGAKARGTIEFYGTDNAIANQSYTLYTQSINPNGDTDLTNANITFTATPAGGAAYTLATAPFYNFNGTNGNVSVTFPAAGVYTIVATVPATTNYPAISSLPLVVTVGATGVTGVYPTTLALSVPATAPSGPVVVTATLSGSTYGPTGRIVVKDATNTEVGRYTLTGAAVSFPVNITLTLPDGASTLTATYNGDDQNQTSTSPSANITVGAVAKVTPALALTAPSGATAGATVTGNIGFHTTSTTPPTGNIVITAIAAGSTTQIPIAMVSAASAFASTLGVSFTFTAPAAGNYTLTANYAGDTNYNTATPSSPSFVVATTQPPLAKSTVPATGTTGIAVTFSGAGSTDPQGETLTYSWNFGDGSTGTGATTTHTYTTPGTYNTVLSVTNTDSLTSTATANIVISAAGPVATTLNISAPASTTAGVNFTANITLKSASASTPAPSGNVILTATPVGGGTASSVTYTAAQAFASGGYPAQVSLTAAGTYTLTASYAGDANYGPSSGSVTTVVSAPPPVTPTLSLSVPTTATAGTSQIGTLSYDFSGSTATATGNILIVATASTGAKTTLATIDASQTKNHLVTAFTFTAPPSGTYAVIAQYAGDAAFNAVNSNVITLAVTTPSFTTTALSLSAPATVTAPNAFTVTVRLTSATTPPSAPTGSVIVTATPTGGGTPTTVATIPATQAFAAGGTTTSVIIFTAGTYTLNATYAGDTNYGGSTGTVGVNVIAPVATITVTVPAPAAILNSTDFTANISLKYTGTTATPTGNIAISAALAGGYNVTFGTVSAAAAYAAGGVNVTINLVNPGTYTLTAVYAGDSKFPAATGTVSVTPLAKPFTLSLTGASKGTIGTPYAVTASITGADSTLKGSVTLTATLNGSTGTPKVITLDAFLAFSTPVASFFTFDTAGTYTITAHYTGDGSFSTTDPAPLTVAVTPPPPSNFKMTLDDQTVTQMDGAVAVIQGSVDKTGLTLTSVGGPGPGPVTLTATNVQADGYVIFRDSVTNKIITTVTPTTAGAHVIIECGDSSSIPTAYLRQLRSTSPISLAGGFGCLCGLAFLGFRKRSVRAMRALYLMSAVCLITISGALIAGCGTTTNQILVTATPVTASSAAPPQSVTFYLTTEQH